MAGSFLAKRRLFTVSQPAPQGASSTLDYPGAKLRASPRLWNASHTVRAQVEAAASIDIIIAALLQDVARLPMVLRPAQRQRLKDILSSTWFLMMGASHPVATERGTRPGDPLADLLYAFSPEFCRTSLAQKCRFRLPFPGMTTQLLFSVLTGPWTWNLHACPWTDTKQRRL